MKDRPTCVGATRIVVLDDGKILKVPAYEHVPTENVRRGDMNWWKADLERRRVRSSQGLFRRLFGGIGR